MERMDPQILLYNDNTKHIHFILSSHEGNKRQLCFKIKFINKFIYICCNLYFEWKYKGSNKKI